MYTETARIDREKEFHDQRFSDPSYRQAKVDRFYALTSAIKEAYAGFLKSRSPGANVLEYGCGTGSFGFDLARWGAKGVVGIDISPVAIDIASGKAKAEGLDTTLTFIEMNAEDLKFDPKSFDLIIGTGILHHLDLAQAIPQIQRVLKDDGAAVFLEPLGYNPFINLFRRLTPDIRSADEHPLMDSDLAGFHKHFDKVEVKYFFLTVLALAPVVRWRGFGVLYRMALSVDDLLFRLPFFRRQAWQVMITLGGARTG